MNMKLRPETEKKKPSVIATKDTCHPFQIRPARRDEMDVVASLVSSSAEWYRSIVDEKDMEEHEVGPEWAEINFRRRDFYLGCVQDEAIGTISLQYFGEYAYLGYIYLDVEHVGNGYGGKLMRFGERMARRKGMKGMALIAHPDATWARKAYLKYGFDCVETEKEAVISWNNGVLEPHYEEGFELYLYPFDAPAAQSERVLPSSMLHSHAA